MSYDYLVVGAGLAGSTIAERLASQLGARVLVVDKRPHVAGNTHDPLDADGLRYHRYGPHIFHTNAQHVVDYLSAFTTWRPYEHRVLARVDGELVPIPINRTTINKLYGLDFDASGIAAFLEARAEPITRIENSEHAIVARVGRELYEKFFRGYTRKQWGLTRQSSTRPYAAASRRGPATTTATLRTPSKRCPPGASPRWSRDARPSADRGRHRLRLCVCRRPRFVRSRDLHRPDR